MASVSEILSFTFTSNCVVIDIESETMCTPSFTSLHVSSLYITTSSFAGSLVLIRGISIGLMYNTFMTTYVFNNVATRSLQNMRLNLSALQNSVHMQITSAPLLPDKPFRFMEL